MTDATPPGCPECGTMHDPVSKVEGLCSVCLIGLGLSHEAVPPAATLRPRTLRPLERGEVAAGWAMPVELLREASRRLRLVAFLVAVSFAGSILLNSGMQAAGWHVFGHTTVKYAAAGAMALVSLLVGFLVRSVPLSARQLIALSISYEMAVALAISIGDNLEPAVADVPLASISWLCVWIVAYALVVPLKPRLALLTGVAAATTWPIAYFFARALGNPPLTTHALLLNCVESYLAAGLALLATLEIRRLQELGCYELVEKLDHGGMGEIWRARHRMLARPVAVKLIRPELLGAKSADEAASLVARFHHEAEATAALHSAHTVTLHDFGVTREGAFYYVMDLLEGLDLETLVRRYGPLPPERAVHVLLQACDSLAEAHAIGLVHRDVKPANIFVGRWGLAWDFTKVLDFGLVKAQWSGAGEDPDRSAEGAIAGTPSFMAPEVVRGGPDVDERVDVYGLGCVAYWLLTGERVFSGRTVMDVLTHHVSTPPQRPSERAPGDVPSALEEIVLACLAKDPAARPASAGEIRERLQASGLGAAWTPSRAQAWWQEVGRGEIRTSSRS